MALKFMDSFDHYATAQLLSKWNSFAGGADDGSGIGAYGRRSGQGIRIRDSAAGLNSWTLLLTKNLITSGNTCIVGCAFQAVTPYADMAADGFNNETQSNCFLSIRQGATTHVWFKINNAGNMTAYRGNNSSFPLGTTSATLTQGVFAYIEIKMVIDNAVGSIEIRFNGTPVLTVPDIDTQITGSATWDEIRFGAFGTLNSRTVEVRFDDVVIMDGSGAEFNNFIGDCRIDARLPTAEGAAADFTPSAGGDNALMVDDATPDDDTTYVSSVTPGNKDLLVVQDSPVVGTPPSAVQISMYAKKTAEGLAPTSVLVRLGGVDYPTAVANLGTSYAYRSVLLPLSPATGLPWTEAEFNAAEFGYLRE